jgi:cold shock CspA family protein
MRIAPQISFRDMPPSGAVETEIREKVQKLEEFSDDLTGCRVVIESPHRHQHKGKLYHILIDLTVPGTEIVVRRDPPEHASHEDIYVAVRDAFDAAKRQLQDYMRRRRGDTKSHPIAQTATVAHLFPAQGYGFLRTPDGREIYFHRNSVVGADFEYLRAGTEVQFVEEEGKEGPQASRVAVGKHHSPE